MNATSRAASLAGLVASALIAAVPGTSPAQAQVAAAACSSSAPAYQSSATTFGVSLTSSGISLQDSLRREEGRFGRIGAVRIFDPSVPPATAWERRSPFLGDRTIITSFRMPPQEVLSGRHDAAIRRFFASAPTGPDIFWNYYHEPERDIADGRFSAAQYRAAFRRLSGISASVCRPNLYPTLILTGWTTVPASGRNWRDYYPGSDVTSVVAFDPYNGATRQPTSYPSPSQLFDSVVNAARQTGKPWGIAETGTMKVAGDAGQGRAQWLDATARYFAERGASWVTYFQSTNRGSFELTDAPSIAAWRSWVSGSKAPSSEDTPPPPQGTTGSVIDAQSTWRYWDRRYPASSWSQPGFDDSSWSRGRAQLGYGDGDETTVIGYGGQASSKNPTAYFRTAVDLGSTVSGATVRMLADDGAVLYVNGAEAGRVNMPSGQVGDGTLASTHVSGSEENTWRTIRVDPSLLRQGRNVVAVEVHQQWRSSSDLTFDLRLNVTS